MPTLSCPSAIPIAELFAAVALPHISCGRSGRLFLQIDKGFQTPNSVHDFLAFRNWLSSGRSVHVCLAFKKTILTCEHTTSTPAPAHLHTLALAGLSACCWLACLSACCLPCLSLGLLLAASLLLGCCWLASALLPACLSAGWLLGSWLPAGCLKATKRERGQEPCYLLLPCLLGLACLALPCLLPLKIFSAGCLLNISLAGCLPLASCRLAFHQARLDFTDSKQALACCFRRNFQRLFSLLTTSRPWPCWPACLLPLCLLACCLQGWLGLCLLLAACLCLLGLCCCLCCCLLGCLGCLAGCLPLGLGLLLLGLGCL